METYLIYKNIAMVLALIGLIYAVITYVVAEDRVKKHLDTFHWRRWEEEHRQLELEVKLRAIEMLAIIVASMGVILV